MGEHSRARTQEQQRRSRARIVTGFATLRDLILFFAGLAIVVHEVLSPKVELYSIGAGLTMMGLPVVLNADERRPRKPDGSESKP